MSRPSCADYDAGRRRVKREGLVRVRRRATTAHLRRTDGQAVAQEHASNTAASASPPAASAPPPTQRRRGRDAAWAPPSAGRDAGGTPSSDSLLFSLEDTPRPCRRRRWRRGRGDTSSSRRLCGVRVGVLGESAREAAASSDMSSDIALARPANGRKGTQTPAENWQTLNR
jgi:hypothetical protein